MYTCQHLLHNLQASKALVSQYINPSDLQAIEAQILAHIEKNTLQVMLYGAYNAGKSTLINALLGKELAKVRDIPTTDTVDEYDWHGYKLLDTPGVNAPIAHEQCTQEQVKRTGAILFVIREGDQDSKDIYARLFALIKQEKQVFIVLNHQLATMDEKVQAYQKIVTTLCSLASEYQISQAQIEQIAIFTINVKTALNAKLKHNEKLLAHSGFTQFFDAFNSWVTAQDSIEQFVINTKNQINALWYAPALEVLQAQNQNTQQGEQKALQHDLRMLTSQQRELERELYNLISYEVYLLKSQISQLLSNNQNQSEFDSALIGLFAPLQHTLEQWLNSKVVELETKLTVTVRHLLKEAECNKDNLFLNALGAQMKNYLGQKENLNELFKMARGFKIPGFKGRWEKTLGSWAGKAATGVQVLSFLWDAHKANQAQNEYNRREREQAIALYQAVDQIASMAVKELFETSKAATDPIFAAKASVIEARLSEISSSNNKLQQDEQTLQRFITQLEAA